MLLLLVLLCWSYQWKFIGFVVYCTINNEQLQQLNKQAKKTVLIFIFSSFYFFIKFIFQKKNEGWHGGGSWASNFGIKFKWMRVKLIIIKQSFICFMECLFYFFMLYDILCITFVHNSHGIHVFFHCIYMMSNI